jgi:hypothetical protein
MGVNEPGQNEGQNGSGILPPKSPDRCDPALTDSDFRRIDLFFKTIDEFACNYMCIHATDVCVMLKVKVR